MEMDGASSFCFPANYVTLKDLQERWMKRKQDEENEAELRRLRSEEEIKKAHNEAEAKNHQSKSKNPRRSAKKLRSSPAAPASHSKGEKKDAGGERKQRNLTNEGKANGFNAKEGKAVKLIAGGRSLKKRQSARSRIPASESDSMVEIAGKRKVDRKGFQTAREECTEEIRRKVADLSISGGDNRRGGRISSGGADRRRRGGGTLTASAKKANEERKGFQIAREECTEEIRRKVTDLSISGGDNRRGGRISTGGADRRRRGGGTLTGSVPAAGMVWVRKTTVG